MCLELQFGFGLFKRFVRQVKLYHHYQKLISYIFRKKYKIFDLSNSKNEINVTEKFIREYLEEVIKGKKCLNTTLICFCVIEWQKINRKGVELDL